MMMKKNQENNNMVKYCKREKMLRMIIKSLMRIKSDTRLKAIKRELRVQREQREQKRLREQAEQRLREQAEQRLILEAGMRDLPARRVMSELLDIDKTMHQLFMVETPKYLPSLSKYAAHQLVCWRRYIVARRSVPVLERINTRYPGFLSSFKMISAKFQFILLVNLAEIVCRLENLTVGRMNQEQVDYVQGFNVDFKGLGIEVDMIDQFVKAVLERNVLIQHLEELNQKLLKEKGNNCGELKEEIEYVEEKLKQLCSKTGVDLVSEDDLPMMQQGSL